MAIDPKELRIGSHVNIKDVRVRVVDINQDVLFFSGISQVDNELKTLGAYSSDEEIKPIPITPELLTELGFKYHEYDNGNLWELEFPDLYKAYLYLEFDEDTTLTYDFHMWNMKEYEANGRVQFLHELENWIYLMYGKELITD